MRALKKDNLLHLETYDNSNHFITLLLSILIININAILFSLSSLISYESTVLSAIWEFFRVSHILQLA